MKKNAKEQCKGFTLIELLAVIIILAVIALIATPIVLNVIDNAKISAAEASAKGYAKAIELNIIDKNIENQANYDGTYDVEENLLGIVNDGQGPAKGYYIVEKNKVKYGEFCINGYPIKYEDGYGKYSKDDFSCYEDETPKVRISISATPEEYSAIKTINISRTLTEGELQYQLGDTSGEWIKYEKPFQLIENITVYARVQDGENTLASATYSVDKINGTVYVYEDFEDETLNPIFTDVKMEDGWKIQDGKLVGNCNEISKYSLFTLSFDEPPKKEGYVAYFSFDVVFEDPESEPAFRVGIGDDIDDEFDFSVSKTYEVNMNSYPVDIVFEIYPMDANVTVTVDNFTVYYVLDEAPTVNATVGSTNGDAYDTTYYYTDATKQDVYVDLHHNNPSVVKYQNYVNNKWQDISVPFILTEEKHYAYKVRGVTNDGTYTSEKQFYVNVDKTQPKISSHNVEGKKLTFSVTDISDSYLSACVSDTNDITKCQENTNKSTVSSRFNKLNQWVRINKSNTSFEGTTSGKYYLFVKDGDNYVSQEFTLQ